jgi:hypothetical protein
VRRTSERRSSGRSRKIRPSETRITISTYVGYQTETIHGFVHCESMPKYFFDGEVENAFVEDEEGIDLPDLEAVKRLAIISARELLSDAAKKGLDVTDRKFKVRSEGGDIVHILNFKDALRKP